MCWCMLYDRTQPNRTSPLGSRTEVGMQSSACSCGKGFLWVQAVPHTEQLCCVLIHLGCAAAASICARYPQWLYCHCSLCWFNRKIQNSVIKLNLLCLCVPTQKWFGRVRTQAPNQCVRWLWISWRHGSYMWYSHLRICLFERTVGWVEGLPVKVRDRNSVRPGRVWRSAGVCGLWQQGGHLS